MYVSDSIYIYMVLSKHNITLQKVSLCKINIVSHCSWGHPAHTWSHTAHGLTLHMGSFYTWSHSAHGLTLRMVSLCTWSHSTYGLTLQMVSLCTWSHSTYGLTLHIVSLCMLYYALVEGRRNMLLKVLKRFQLFYYEHMYILSNIVTYWVAHRS